MKKISIIILAIMLITTLSVGLMACSIGGGNTGKYYLYENGEIDESSYIELKSGGKWTDGEDSGTYEINGNKITFYIDKEEFLSGTISDGVLELSMWGFGTIVYKKSGTKGNGTTTTPNQPGNGDNPSDNPSKPSDNPSKPSDNPSVPDDNDGEFLVTYNLNYGSNPVVQHKTVNKKVDFVPDRTGYVFNGWFLLKDMSEDNEPILGALWDTSQTVTNSNLVLYADWYAKPEDGALPTPVVELDGNTFRWASISGANGYKVTIYQGTNEVDSFTHYGNSFTFSGYEAGSYQVTIMAKGDGVSTINSGTVTRNILYKYLGKITATLNQETMVVSWSEVQYAEEYVVYLDNTLIMTTSSETSCQIPEADVGTHNILVKAQLSGWISSSDSVSYTINKLKKPDNFVVSFDEEEMQYTISWASVRGANQYKVYGVGGVRTVNTNSIVIGESDWGSNETNKSIQVYAFDSNANYLQSNASENISLDRIFKVQAVSENGTATVLQNGMLAVYAKAGTEVEFTANVYSGYTFIGWYDQTGNTKMSSDLTYTMAISAGNYRPIAKCRKVSVESNNSEAGSVALCNDQGVDANVSTTINFNTQGGSSVSSVVLRSGEAFTYPSIPTKSGYVFAGWYGNASCSGSPYDFSNINSTSITVYAKWIAYSGAGIIYPNSSQSIYVYSQSSSTTRYYAFVPLVSESITIYTTGDLDTYGYLYNVNKSQIASDDDGGDGSNFKITYNVTAGQLYYIRPCGYSSNGYATVVINANMPQYTASSTLGGDYFVVGDIAKLTATTNNGYTFIGWFDGDTKVSDQLVYDLVMPAEDKTYTAKWCQVTLDTNDTSAGTVSGITSTYKVGDSATITASTNNGYTWLGWYDGDTKLTEELSYTFTMSAENKTYTAKWANCNVTLAKNFAAAGSVSGVEGATAIGMPTTITATTNTGYTWVGWFDGDTKLTDELSYTFTMTAESKTYTAKWSKVTLDRNNTSAGTVGGLTTAYKVGDSATITATTNNGYTWVGWYDGDAKLTDELSYTFTMAAEDKTYTAQWTYYTVTTNTNMSEAGTYTSKSQQKVTVGNQVTLEATTNDGYTWVGWFDGDTKLTDELSYTFTMTAENKTYTAKWTYYTITTNTNMPEAGTYTSKSQQKVTVGSQVTLEAIANTGYTFAGWYDGDTLLSDELSYIFTMTAEDKTYTAKWTYYTISTDTNMPEAGIYTIKSQDMVTAGTSVILEAITNHGYTWIGWFDGDSKLTDELSYTFTMPTESKIYTAKWSKFTMVINDDGAGTVELSNNQNTSSTQSIIIRFNTQGGSSVADVILRSGEAFTYPSIPTKSGYVFAGWYGDASCSGEPFDFSRFDNSTSITVYAKWIAYSGEGILYPNSSQSLYLYSKGSAAKYYAFVPLVSEIITIYTMGGLDTYGFLYTSGKTQVASNDDSGDGNNFKITYNVTAGQLYYISPCGYNTNGTATVVVNANIPQYSNSTMLERITFVAGNSVTITASTNDGYTWLGWYDGETLLTDELTYHFAMPSENITYTATWAYYTVTTNTNMSEAGTYTIKDQEKITAGNSVTLEATTNNGYTWVGWFDGDTLLSNELSYTFTMPAENKTYTAQWTYYTVTTNTNMSEAGTYTRKTQQKVAVGNQVTLEATTNNGYTWVGWYDRGTKLTDELSYTFTMTAENKTYTAKWMTCPINLVKNIEEAGNVSGVEGATVAGKPTTITATTNNGYTWVGWYDGDIKLTDELSYTFAMPVESKTYMAKWTYYTLTTETNMENAGSFTIKNQEKVSAGQRVSLKATTYSGYEFIGWYNGNFKMTDKEEYLFTMDAKDLTLTAWWNVSEEMSNYIFSSTIDSCVISNVINKNFSNMDIPNYVTAIREGAFSGCSSLTSITIPDSITSIGYGAFSGCSSLESMIIPFVGTVAGKTSSDTYQYPFGYIFGTSSYTGGVATTQSYYGSSTSSTTFTTYYIPSSLKSVTVTGGNILCGAFYSCSGLTKITIPNNVKSIGVNAFRACTSLTSITIPDSVTSIGSGAFYNCSGLTRVDITNLTKWFSISFASVESNPLYYAHYLYLNEELVTDLIMPDSVTSIRDWAFAGCISLTSITIRNSLIRIGDKAFYNCSNINSIALFATVLGIGEYAFSGCESLSRVDIDSLEEWCAIDFEDYTSNPLANNVELYLNESKITDLVIPDSVTSIGDYAFYCCSGITSITIHNDVKNIGFAAFSGVPCQTISIPFTGNTNLNDNYTHFGYIFGANSYTDNSTRLPYALRNVIITGGTSIKSNAFYGCRGLVSIVVPDTVTSIQSKAFYECALLKNINIPEGVTGIGDYAFYDCALTNVSLPSSVGYIGSGAFSNNTALKSIVLPNGVSTIEKSTFSGCSALTNINIPNIVTSIGNSAFAGCSSITSITIPDSVTSIGNQAFLNCTQLATIVLSKNIDVIRTKAFYGCSSIAEIILPNNVTSIENDAFNDCRSMTKITIPKTVSSIGNYAFQVCSNLTSITFQGTKAQWNAISKGSGWNVATGAYTIYCTDGNISKS